MAKDKPPISFDSFKSFKTIEYINYKSPKRNKVSQEDLSEEYVSIIQQFDDFFVDLYTDLVERGFSESIEKNLRVAFSAIQAGLDNDIGIQNDFQNYVEIMEKKLNPNDIKNL